MLPMKHTDWEGNTVSDGNLMIALMWLKRATSCICQVSQGEYGMKNVRDNQDLVYPRLPTFMREDADQISVGSWNASETSSWKKSKQSL